MSRSGSFALGQPSLPVFVVEDGARGEVHAVTALVHEGLQRQRCHLAEDVGELGVGGFGQAMRIDEASGCGRRGGRPGLRVRRRGVISIPFGASVPERFARKRSFNHSCARDGSRRWSGTRCMLDACDARCAGAGRPRDHRMSEKFDAIVVGSGFGGSITACRLAEKGMKVLVLERGRRWTPADYPRKPGDPWTYDVRRPREAQRMARPALLQEDDRRAGRRRRRRIAGLQQRGDRGAPVVLRTRAGRRK